MGSKTTKRGYGRVTNKAMKLMFARGKDLNRTDKFIFFTLIVKQGASVEARIANKRLALIADLNIRSVQRSIDKLFNCGLIKIKAQSIYEVNQEYLYKKGRGFGEVYFDVLTSDLSISAKLLYVVNAVASGKDVSHFNKREKLMSFCVIGKDTYTTAMKELEVANVLVQSRRLEEKSSGIIQRGPNNKILLPKSDNTLTFTRITDCNKKVYDNRGTQQVTIEGLSERQTKDLENDNRRTAYHEPLSPTNTTNHYHESFTADSSNHGVGLLYYYQNIFRRGFRSELLDNYDVEEVERVVQLFTCIRSEVGRENWTISEGDFEKLIDHVQIFNADEYPGLTSEIFIDFIRDAILHGRKGNSLSYWLSEGIREAFRGSVNASSSGLEFSLDSKACMI